MALLADGVSGFTAAVLGCGGVRYAPPLSLPSVRITNGPRKKSRTEKKKPGSGKGGEAIKGVGRYWKDSPNKESQAAKGFGGPVKLTSSVGAGDSGGFGSLAEESVTWRCASGCGACCKLRKGPDFPSAAEIFSDVDPQLAEMVESMIGADGWCIHYDHSTRTCSIYSERPFFCRVEPEVFFKLYGIDHNSFNSEACRACRDTIKTVYGFYSQELKKFNATIHNKNLVDTRLSPT